MPAWLHGFDASRPNDLIVQSRFWTPVSMGSGRSTPNAYCRRISRRCTTKRKRQGMDTTRELSFQKRTPEILECPHNASIRKERQGKLCGQDRVGKDPVFMRRRRVFRVLERRDDRATRSLERIHRTGHRVHHRIRRYLGFSPANTFQIVRRVWPAVPRLPEKESKPKSSSRFSMRVPNSNRLVCLDTCALALPFNPERSKGCP